MPSPNSNFSEIVTTTLRRRAPLAANQILRRNALLQKLEARGRVKTFSGGRTIARPLVYAMNGTYQRYSGYQQLNTSPSDIFTAAEFPIRQSAVAVSISGLEMLQNAGEEAVLDLLEGRIENAYDTLSNGLSYDAYSDGSLSGQVIGLQGLISSTPTSGTVGGIDRATWEFWRNIKFSAVTDGGAAMSAANIIGYMNQLAIQLMGPGQEGPDLAFAGNTAFNYFLSALQAIQIISGADTGESGFSSLKYNIGGRKMEVILDGGFQGYSADSASFGIPTGGAPTSSMYMINSKHLFWQPHSARNAVEIAPDRFTMNQDAMVKLIGWAGNMTIDNCRFQGVLTA